MVSETFSRCALMQDLPSDDIARIYAAGDVKVFRAGETVIAEGQLNTNIFVVLRGAVEVCLPERDDRFTPVKLARLGPGSCVVEYSFIDRKPTSAAVVAHTESEVFVLSNDALSRVLAGDTGLERTIYRNLLVLMIERLREDNAALEMIRPQRN
jgi:CRP-like cAMP-binding protein